MPDAPDVMPNAMNDASQTDAATGSAAIQEARDEVLGLINDARAYFEAERNYWSGRAAFTGKTLKSASILGVILAGLVIGLLIILALGGLLILAKFYGPIAATLIMAGVLILLSAIVAFALTKTIKSLKFKND